MNYTNQTNDHERLWLRFPCEYVSAATLVFYVGIRSPFNRLLDFEARILKPGTDFIGSEKDEVERYIFSPHLIAVDDFFANMERDFLN